MHWLQWKSNKVLKHFGLNEFLTNNTVLHPRIFKTLQQRAKQELLELSHHMHNSAFHNVWFG